MQSTSSRSIAARLQDILENIRLAREFIAGLSFEEFQEDRRTTYAIVRCLEIISEASRWLPSDLKLRHPEIPWAEMAGAGSVYRHGYHAVRDDLIWKAVQERLEALRIVAEEELTKLPKI